MFQILDVDKLRQTPVDTRFFPYCEVDCFIQKQALINVLQAFPDIQVRGSIPAHKLQYGTFFQRLLDELHSDELRTLIAEKFEINLSHAETLLTLRGQTDLVDGKIHTDTPNKLMTLLLYLNQDWREKTGNLRLLHDAHNLENYFAEITPTAGKLLIFKVTDNCWHGHYPFSGKRHTIQLNYVVNQTVVNKEIRKHSRSYVFKKIFHTLRHLGHAKNLID